MYGRLGSWALLLAGSYAMPSALNARDSTTTAGSNKPVSTDTAAPLYAPTQPYGGSNASAYQAPAWVPHLEKLVPALSQTVTNGKSVLGTLDAPRLPKWVPGSPTPQGTPWSTRTTKSSLYNNIPNTGVTRSYTFNVTEMQIAPDGVVRNGLVINGAFPGPTIEANWGDYFEITVNNMLETNANYSAEGTSIHWHGLLQTKTPWMDGVPGITQCPIAPGSSFTYRFQADLYGSSWYHSHYSAQYNGGIVGAMIIYGPTDNISYDEDLGPIFLTDWFHQEYIDLVAQVMDPEKDNEPTPPSVNNLINGKMNFPCANATGYQCTPNAGISKFQVESGKSYRLRLINAGTEAIQKFSIDGYNLTVFANDFVPIEPYTTDVVTLGIGQRSDVVFNATGKPTDSVFMRADLGPNVFNGGCTINNGVSPVAVAAIYYQNANTSSVPTTQSSVPESKIVTCQNDDLSLTVPTSALTVASNPTTEFINVTHQSNGTTLLFYMDNSTFRVDYNSPTLLLANLGETNFTPESNVHAFPNATNIRLIWYNDNFFGAHPIHLHGHNFQVLAQGTGYWDGTITNPTNPQQRDTQLLPPAVTTNITIIDEPAYIVLQFTGANAGVWPMHCHIAWHVSAGLYINVYENAKGIQKEMQIPSIMAETCRSWAAWTGTHIPDQIDSGL